MIKIRKSGDRGHANHGWLDSYHTFSFADYYDPEQMSFRSLRVINDDRIAGGGGFGTHPHRDMEIITYVIEGQLEHRDSMGNGAVMNPGDVQRMTAGTGVQHSEFNHSKTNPLHFLQIWIVPAQKSLPPGYEQKSFKEEMTSGKLVTVTSGHANNGALRINQDVDLLIGKLNTGDKTSYQLKPGRHAWVQIAEGKVELNGQLLAAGDGAAISDETALNFSGKESAQVLLFDLN